MFKQPSKWIKSIIGVTLITFLLMNLVAIFHAHHFTHFAEPGVQKTGKSEQLSFGQALKAMVFGVNIPRPENCKRPDAAFETIVLQSNFKIQGWYIKAQPTAKDVRAKGTIVLFHGYGGEKSLLLDRSSIFNQWNYDTFLIDFMGSGGSEGNTTTIGFQEATQVKTVYEYLVQKGVKNIYLYGTSMGAVAIMKAIHDHDLSPKGIVIECPFGSMYQTVSARFNTMNVPAFPMSALLVFWGGIQNDFWAFDHNPITYARSISCPALLLYGGKDKTVSREEIYQIYNNFKGPKRLRVYAEAGHENYLLQYQDEWSTDVRDFLNLTLIHQ